MRRLNKRGPLTDQQRQLVEENRGLVGLHLKRSCPGKQSAGIRRDYADLYQEGLLGLMRAAQDYDPACGIPFPAYALRRIHRAVGYASSRRFSLICVPHAELRRARREKRPVSAGLVSTVNLDRLQNLACGTAAGARAEGPTIGHHLHERFVQAVAEAQRALTAAAQATLSVRRSSLARVSQNFRPVKCAEGVLLAAIVSQRLLISNKAWRTPLREIARHLGHTYAAVRACERRLLREVERRLRADAAVAVLLRAAAASPLGRQGPIDAEIETQLRDASPRAFMCALAAADERTRSEILRRLLEAAGEDLHPAICRSLDALPEQVRQQVLAQAHESVPSVSPPARRRCA